MTFEGTQKPERAGQADIPEALRLLGGRLRRSLLLPQWFIFRLTHSHPTQDVRHPESQGDAIEQVLEQKERHLQSILAQTAQGGSSHFLEIGIGEHPRLARVKFMQQNNVRYTGCDFESVCVQHAGELKQAGLGLDHVRFVSNRVGTYAWTLFDLLQDGEAFDVIYVDGHHTFYVDFPAFILADLLLKPGGYLLVDDIQWTLEFMQNTMARRFAAWRFYRKMYDFSQYDLCQRKLPHIRMIVERVLIARLGYSKVEEYSPPEWWALRKMPR